MWFNLQSLQKVTPFGEKILNILLGILRKRRDKYFLLSYLIKKIDHKENMKEILYHF